MKIYLKILLLILMPFFCGAQDNQEELLRLRSDLAYAENDTIQMDVFISIGIYYGESNRDSSLWYRDKALSLARALDLKIVEADILIGQGYMYSVIGDYATSLQLLLQAIKITENPANEISIFQLTDGHTDFTSRLSTLSVAHFVLAQLWGYKGDFKKEIQGYKNAIKIGESSSESLGIVYAYSALGEAYFKIGEIDSALIYQQKALPLFAGIKKSSDNKYIGMVYNSLGKIYATKGSHTLAKNAYLKSIRFSSERNNLNYLGNAYLGYGEYFKSQNNIDSALFYSLKAIETFTVLESKSSLADALLLASSAFSADNITDSAYYYLEKATQIKDSLNQMEKKSLMDFQAIGFNEQLKVKELEQAKIASESRFRTIAMLAGIAVALLISFLLYLNNRNRKKANVILQEQKAKIEFQNKTLEKTLSNLKSTQSQLIQSEKMASLGELTAGIAHEIQNPLNFVNNFSDVSAELLAEAKEELDNGGLEEAKEIMDDLINNLEKINHHGQRASSIVKGMLDHSRAGSGEKKMTDINALCDEFLRLSYHGLRAKDQSFNAKYETSFDESLPKINVVSQDIGRVVLNLINNAFQAVGETGEEKKEDWEPIVRVATEINSSSSIRIIISDNGPGIPKDIKDKIFQPFFTTKPTGQGTGLGLSLSYDIVKAHGGEIKVTTEIGKGSKFMITLPKSIVE